MSTEEQRHEAQAVSVRIFNQLFSLRSEQDGEYVRRVAGLVDARMQEIAQLVPSGDVLKIAILAALNIADELCRLRQFQEEQQAQTDSASSEPPQGLARELEAAQEAAPDDTEGGQKAWSYEDIFEFAPSKRSSGRMTEQVANRLRSLRQTEQGALTIKPEERDG